MQSVWMDRISLDPDPSFKVQFLTLGWTKIPGKARCSEGQNGFPPWPKFKLSGLIANLGIESFPPWPKIKLSGLIADLGIESLANSVQLA